ncbi:MAG TPA: hypothetical protein VNO30_33360 [Kofleriaceae bacterium]|nr:hypothetical protein [Kofleriaceae bacterium]
MPPSRKSAGPKRLRESHVRPRHVSNAAPNAGPPSCACPLERHFLALDAVGWRVVEIRPPVSRDEGALWRVAITRVDLVASMTATASDPDVALAELVRYASADGREQG